jgi:thiosulfate dehydrogenase [quinone] large subunit
MSRRMPNDLPSSDRASRVAALAIRLSCAYLWFENLDWKTPPNFGQQDRAGLWGFTAGAVEHPVFPPYSWVVEHVILPNYIPFAWTVYAAEIALGVFLLLGLATRFWALVAVAQSFVIYLTVGAQPHEWPWTYVLMMVAHLAVFALAAGRVAGLDAVLRARAAAASGAAPGQPPSRALRWLLRAT